MSDIKVSPELVAFVKEQTHVKNIYFTADGQWYLNAYSKNGSVYAVIDPVGDKHTEVVKRMSREEILAEA